jgi:hypothetical protein
LHNNIPDFNEEIRGGSAYSHLPNYLLLNRQVLPRD